MVERIPRPLLILALLAIFALGLALGTNAYFARKLTVSPERLAAAKAGAPTPRAATAANDDDPAVSTDSAVAEAVAASRRPKTRTISFWQEPIIRRNIFDSANTIAGKPPVELKEPQTDGEVDKESDLAATLLATTVATDPIWSTALISTDDGVEVYRIDEALLDATIKDIQRPTLERAARIIVLRGGELEYLEAGGKARKKPSKAQKDEGDAKKKRARGGRRDWAGIKKTGDNAFDVPEDDVKWALDNLDKMSREARVVPNFADGQTNGFKVFAIRRNSALRKMGLKNNDVLTSVNGFDLSNTEKALEIYGKLQSEKSFTLEVLRNGEPVSMEYNIR